LSGILSDVGADTDDKHIYVLSKKIVPNPDFSETLTGFIAIVWRFKEIAAALVVAGIVLALIGAAVGSPTTIAVGVGVAIDAGLPLVAGFFLSKKNEPSNHVDDNTPSKSASI
ncbi:MAG: hypothetical protein QNK11_05945, partial [Legionella sp.]|nr:hypothetical protein [Legionella sp.]